MSLELVGIVFKVGKIFSLTPASLETERVTFSEKCKTVTFIITSIVGLILNFIVKKFYSKFLHIKSIVCVLEDTALLTIYIIVVLDVVFLKRTQWCLLVNHLKLIAVHVKPNLFRTCLIFVGAHLVHLSVFSYLTAAWYPLQKTRFFKEFTLSLVFYYFKFLHQCLLYVILKMIKVRYRYITKQMGALFYRSNPREIFCVLKKTQIYLHTLKQTINTFNYIFGWPIMFIMIFTTVNFLNYLDFIFVTALNLKEKNIIHGIISDVVLTGVYNLGGAVYLILLCDGVLQEAENVLEIMCQLGWHLTNLGPQEKKSLYLFTNSLRDNFPRFSAARFFDINRSTIFGILGTVITFLIIMIQFNTTATASYY